MNANVPAFLRFRLPVYVWAALISVSSSFPLQVPPSLEIPFADKLAHAGIYFILGFLLARAIRNSLPAIIGGKQAFYASFVGFLYGALDEWHQSFVPLRHADFGDAVVDAIGAVVGAVVFIMLASNAKRGIYGCHKAI